MIVDDIYLAEAALDGGAPVIQVRIKDATDRERYERTQAIVDLCSRFGAVCIVNDRADIAVATGAAGVHVGDDDLSVTAARRVVKQSMIVGGTTRDPSAALRMEQQGAAYVGVGPVYTTGSKAGLPDPLGPEGVRAIADAVWIPVIAIAGVTAARVPELLAAGAHGVAVIGAVANADDPRKATEDLVAAVERGS